MKITKTAKPFREWTVDEVFEWVKQLTDTEEAKKLKDQKVRGSSLLRLSKDELQAPPYNVLGGSATDLMAALEERKTSGGMNSHRLCCFRQWDKIVHRCLMSFLISQEQARSALLRAKLQADTFEFQVVSQVVFPGIGWKCCRKTSFWISSPFFLFTIGESYLR